MWIHVIYIDSVFWALIWNQLCNMIYSRKITRQRDNISTIRRLSSFISSFEFEQWTVESRWDNACARAVVTRAWQWQCALNAPNVINHCRNFEGWYDQHHLKRLICTTRIVTESAGPWHGMYTRNLCGISELLWTLSYFGCKWYICHDISA